MNIIEIIVWFILIAALLIFTYTKAYSRGYKNGGDMVLNEWRKFESGEEQWEGIGD